MQLLQKRVGKWNQIVVATLSRDSGLFWLKYIPTTVVGSLQRITCKRENLPTFDNWQLFQTLSIRDASKMSIFLKVFAFLNIPLKMKNRAFIKTDYPFLLKQYVKRFDMIWNNYTCSLKIMLQCLKDTVQYK